MKVLETQKLTKIFNPETHTEVKAVDGIDFSINKGEIVLIEGPSGSGKTTFLTMMGGLLRPTKGKIFFNGKEIQSLNRKELVNFRRQNIGFIFQSFNLLQNLSSLENVEIAGFGVEQKKEKAKELLDRLSLGKRLNYLPNDLSGGERQRVAVARALINNPTIILADEPTANLDKKTGHEVMDLLCSIGCEQGKSVIIVSHDERIKDIAHRVLYIEDGKLVREEIGSHSKTCKMSH